MFFELTLPLSLVMFLVEKDLLRRLALSIPLITGVTGLVFTYSRTGLLSAVIGGAASILLARYRNLLSKPIWYAVVGGSLLGTVVAAPYVYSYLTSRPEAFEYRFVLMDKGFEMIRTHPILGVGLNNSSASDPFFLPTRDKSSIATKWTFRILHSHYQLLTVETGLPGALLHFGFFLALLLYALGASRSRDRFAATLATGLVGSVSAIALHWNADPFGLEGLNTILWFQAGLVMVLWTRYAQGPRAAAVERQGAASGSATGGVLPIEASSGA